MYKPHRPTIATICGSTRQRDDILWLARRLTLQGLLVFSPNVFVHEESELIPEDKEMLDALHFEKIKLSDIVYFIAKPEATTDEEAFGESTTRELRFSSELKKPRVVLHPEQIWDPERPIRVLLPIQRRMRASAADLRLL